MRQPALQARCPDHDRDHAVRLRRALDSAWPDFGAASLPLVGTAYLVTTLGHVCYVFGAAMGLKAVWLRSLSDDEIVPFMRTRIIPLVAAAALVMVACVLMSPLTSTMPAASLY